MKDALDLAPIDALVGVDPVGNFGQVAGPDILPVEQHGVIPYANPGTAQAVTARAIAAHADLRGAVATRCSM